MAWTTPVDQATGFLVTAAVYNGQIIDNLSYLHGDAGAVIDVSSGSQFLQTAGQIIGPSGTTDTRLTRQAATLLRLADATGTGAGNLQLGAISGSIGTSGTPNAANFVTRWNITSTGTFTINAPTNPPSGNVSGAFCMFLQNGSGGTITFSFNSVYVFSTITAPTAGNGMGIMWIWNPSTSKWVMVCVFQSGTVPM